MIAIQWVIVVALLLVSNTRTFTVSGNDMVCLESNDQDAAYLENPTCTNAPPSPGRPECNLYMAESTIPGAGLGLFTAIPRNKGDSFHSDEVYILLLELPYHQGKDDGEFFDITSSYVWDGPFMGMQFEAKEGSDFDVSGFWSGLGATPNCHFGIINIARSMGCSHHEDITQQRASNPGAGAYSYFHGPDMTATRDIPVGSELFLSYGDL